MRHGRSAAPTGGRSVRWDVRIPLYGGGDGRGSLRRGPRAPSHAVDLARLVTDDVPHPSAVHTPGGGAAAAVPEGRRAAPRLGVAEGDGCVAATRRRVRVPGARPGRAKHALRDAGGGHGRGQPRPCRSAGWAPAATRSATAARGSRPVTRDSPTRTASAPALA